MSQTATEYATQHHADIITSRQPGARPPAHSPAGPERQTGATIKIKRKRHATSRIYNYIFFHTTSRPRTARLRERPLAHAPRHRRHPRGPLAPPASPGRAHWRTHLPARRRRGRAHWRTRPGAAYHTTDSTRPRAARPRSTHWCPRPGTACRPWGPPAHRLARARPLAHPPAGPAPGARPPAHAPERRQPHQTTIFTTPHHDQAPPGSESTHWCPHPDAACHSGAHWPLPPARGAPIGTHTSRPCAGGTPTGAHARTPPTTRSPLAPRSHPGRAHWRTHRRPHHTW